MLTMRIVNKFEFQFIPPKKKGTAAPLSIVFRISIHASQEEGDSKVYQKQL